jgi:predicted O-linked N-acetylglucosamine transferase (SPINDLY family)
MNKTASDYVTDALNVLRTGDAQTATTLLNKAIAIDPQQADALHLLGVIAFQSGDAPAAIDLIQRALKSRPAFPDAYSNLGTVLISLRRFEEAEAALRRAVALHPSQAIYRFNLGNTLAAQKKLKEAVQEYEHAVKLQPGHAEAWSNLGTAYSDLENIDAATKCFERAIQVKPTYVEAHYNLANAYRDRTRLTAAEAEIRKAIELQPTYAKAHNTLGNILSESLRSGEAVASFQRATELDPTSLSMASNVLSCMQYVPGITDAALSAAHAHWVGAHNDIFTAPMHRVTDRAPDRPLTVGFVSPDLGHHPCGFLSVGLFEHLNLADIRPIVFSSRRAEREDHISKRIMAVSEWRRVQNLSDAELADDISKAAVDILIDMSGHTSGHRLAAFARKPAPLQMTWLGYVGSTGLPTIDYIIADRWHAPEATALTGPENVLRLDDGYTSFEPLTGAADIAPLPALRNGHITFGSFNNATKLNADLIRSYAAIMTRVPRSRIILAFRGLDDVGVTQRLRGWFVGSGITPDRVEIRGYAKPLTFLNNYNDVDIALDTFPYSGGQTTCEALWMGVPVVTFPGRTFAGRHATSYMSNAGLADFVAVDQTAFEDLAVAKASDLGALQTLRATMREHLNSSAVRDHKKFAASFSTAMRRAWHGYLNP